MVLGLDEIKIKLTQLFEQKFLKNCPGNASYDCTDITPCMIPAQHGIDMNILLTNCSSRPYHGTYGSNEVFPSLVISIKLLNGASARIELPYGSQEMSKLTYKKWACDI